MIVDFRLPHLGDGIEAADVIKIPLKVGDKIEVDQVVVEIETDKATVEVPSDVSGIVKEIFVKEGTKAKVGEPIISVDASTEQSTVGKEKPEVKIDKKDEKKQKGDDKIIEKEISNETKVISDYKFKIPMLGENITSAQITKVLIKSGDKIETDQIVLEIETDKATVEVPSEVSGTVKEVTVKDGDKVDVGSVAFTVETSSQGVDKPAVSAQPEENKTVAEPKPVSAPEKIPFQKVGHSHAPSVINLPKDIIQVVVPAAPSVRRFAREIGVDVHKVRGSGAHGRISFEDIKTYAKNLNEQIQKGGFSGGSVGIVKEILPDFSKWGEIEIQPMSNIRRKTAEHLSFAWATVPHVTQFDKADITELEKIRKQFGKQVEAAGGKLTVTSILLKVLASAIKVFPQFNSSVDMEKNEIIYKKFVNIGVAVDTDRGLLVPVIRDVDKKNIIELSKELQEFSKKARDKKLSPDDMTGGCFTISNLGGIGGTYFTPIVNSPEVAIMGVSRSSYEPVYADGKFEPRLMMPLSLSYDHRMIDGADGIRFLRWVVNALENPFLLSLEG
ncbi:MAG: branched-chain alpha-keto acid dehydrogenase subunit E2 [Ignavibacteriae bacterium HGW-Ignavibacteriae-3]|nr:MAG: branched-chain alpha-keto acid dehydrogenase subunit E2 [Ignavibacteriae bacterium HGW-Ignavibacteriae-3]